MINLLLEYLKKSTFKDIEYILYLLDVNFNLICFD